jgi:hypothetical protein
MKKTPSDLAPRPGGLALDALDPATRERLLRIAALPDDAIDLSDPDAPEATDWTGAERGRFQGQAKKLRSLRIDADVLAYFEAQGPGYQARINAVLRESMLAARRRPHTEQA